MLKRRFWKALSLNLPVLVGLTGTTVTFFFVIGLLMYNEHTVRKRNVEGQLPNTFPIVVRTGERVQIVWGEKLERFKAEHPNYSFLIPIDQSDIYRAQIEANVQSAQSPPSFDQLSEIPWEASFKIEAISPERQKFEVYATWDDDRVNIGWYEASHQELFPKSHVFYFGPGLVLKNLPVAIPITVAIWLIPIWLWKYRKRLRGPSLPL